VITKYLVKFQSPRAITRSKIIGPERNVNSICNLSLYTHIPNIKSISQSNCFISELVKHVLIGTSNTGRELDYRCLDCQICVWKRWIGKVWIEFEGTILPCRYTSTLNCILIQDKTCDFFFCFFCSVVLKFHVTCCIHLPMERFIIATTSIWRTDQNVLDNMFRWSNLCWKQVHKEKFAANLRKTWTV
jgi:hypothetical protein